VRQYARIFNRGFAAIAICVLVGLWAGLVLEQDLFGDGGSHGGSGVHDRRRQDSGLDDVIVDTSLRLARAAGMSETLIRVILAAILAAAFGTAIATGWVLWYRRPPRDVPSSKSVTGL
jgi:hypothetical protein